MKFWLIEYGIYLLLLFVIFFVKMFWNLKMYLLFVLKFLNLVIYVVLYSLSYKLFIMIYVSWMFFIILCCFCENYFGVYESLNGKFVEWYFLNVV